MSAKSTRASGMGYGQTPRESGVEPAQQPFVALAAAVSDGVLLVNRARHIVFANRRACELLDVDAESLLGTELWPESWQLRDADGQAVPAQQLPDAQVFASGELQAARLLCMRRGDRLRRWFLASAAPYRAASEELAVVCLSDVSAKRELEEQLRHSQKLEAVGRLAGGVAHDFNNLLMVIRGSCDLLRGLQESDSERVDDIREATVRAAALTRQLLAFSRKQLQKPEVVELNELVTGVVPMLKRLISHEIALHVDLDPNAGRIKADPRQLEQVLLNLVINARDAMPEGGRLTLRTWCVELGPGRASQALNVVPGRYALVSITDTGHGMDQETLEHMFEPFYTTKQCGTGLGLSTVYGIVQQCGGQIRVDSDPARGSHFELYFPSCDDGSDSSEQPALHGGRRHEATLLIVDDERKVRRTLAALLRNIGYRVLEAASGPEALVASDHFGGQIHALVTDVLMPGMSGVALAHRFAESRPGAIALYMSGHSDGVTGLPDDNLCLAKPVSVSELDRALQRRLSEQLTEVG